MTGRLVSLLAVSLLIVSCGDDSSDTNPQTGPHDQGSGAASSGGAAGTGNTAGGGGTDSPRECELTECFRPYNCVRECGGEIESSGCCPCEAPLFDNISCPE